MDIFAVVLAGISLLLGYKIVTEKVKWFWFLVWFCYNLTAVGVYIFLEVALAI